MLVGRNPGQKEDQSGTPFIGASGDLLNRTLASLQIDRSRLFVTNALKCHTAKNREPTSAEYAECYCRHLVREFDVAAPELVLTFGRDAFRQITDNSMAIGKARQRFWTVPAHRFALVAMLHPSAVLQDRDRMTSWLTDWLWLTKTPIWSQVYGSK